jgi:hypothetical protein
MTQPPNYKPHVVTAEKLSELFNAPAFQQKLSRCREQRTVQVQNPWLDSQRKKELVRYIDIETNEEIALMAVYTDNPPGTLVQRIILRVCNDNNIYDLRLL